MPNIVLLFFLAFPALVRNFNLANINGTISFEMLSNLTDKHLVIARGTIDTIEDDALCASPFEIIEFPWNEQIPNITKEMFGQCPSLTTLDINHWNNQNTAHWTFESDAFSQLTSLKYIYLTGADITEISKDTLVLPQSLVKFYVSRSKSLTNIKLDVFDGLTNLELIFLENNGIKVVEGKFDKLPKLKEVTFTQNFLDVKFPWNALKNLENLEIVRLFHTPVKVDNVEEVMENVPKLKELNLGYSGSYNDCGMVRNLDRDFKSKFGRQDVVVNLRYEEAKRWCDVLVPVLRPYHT